MIDRLLASDGGVQYPAGKDRAKSAEAVVIGGLLTALAAKSRQKTIKAIVEKTLFKEAMEGFRNLATSSKFDIEQLRARLTQRLPSSNRDSRSPASTSGQIPIITRSKVQRPV